MPGASTVTPQITGSSPQAAPAGGAREQMKRAQSVEVLSILAEASPRPHRAQASTGDEEDEEAEEETFYQASGPPPQESPPPLPPRRAAALDTGRRDVLGAAAPRGGVLRSARGGLRPAGPRRRAGDEDGGLGAHPALIEQYPDVPHAPAHALDVGARAGSSRRRKIIECEAPSIIQVIYFAGGG